MKTASRILLTFSILAFFAGVSFSQVASTATPAKATAKSETVVPGKFVDTNNNGICDNHESKTKCATGKNFVDKNGDGKCDNCGSTGNCQGPCNGKGQVKGNCCGQGPQGAGCGKGVKSRNCCATEGSKTPGTK